MYKKKNRIFLLILFLLLSMILPVNRSFADNHRLEDLRINVFINKDGSARIIEKRQAYLTEGTENFIVIGNLGDSKIKDFVVKEGDIVYEYNKDWNIDASREEKTYRNGIVETSNGYELCWGIGEYGSHNYVVEYTVTNFVKEFQNRQGVFWQFVNDMTNIPPQNVVVTIESHESFTNDNSNIWAFGYEGEINFENNKIVARSSRPFNNTNYLTILVEFEENFFHTNSKVNKSFEEVKEGAFKGSDYNPYGFKYFLRKILASPLNIIIAIVIILSILLEIIYKISEAKPKRYKRKFKGEYYRDYPYDGDFIDIFYILEGMALAKPDDLMTGYMLKWINKGWIDVVYVEIGRIFKREDTALKFNKIDVGRNTLEEKLYKMMLRAAGSNRILEKNEFTKWAKENYSSLESWKEDARDKSFNRLIALEYMKIEEKRFLFRTRKKHVLTEKGKKLENNIHKFVNYLHDFSLLNEHEAVNVKIWDNLMIWAGLLGLTKVVYKEFKKLYPYYDTESIYKEKGIHTANVYSRTASRTTTSSSGGGGSSSSGGGGGSFGGGSGGGTR